MGVYNDCVLNWNVQASPFLNCQTSMVGCLHCIWQAPGSEQIVVVKNLSNELKSAIIYLHFLYDFEHLSTFAKSV